MNKRIKNKNLKIDETFFKNLKKGDYKTILNLYVFENYSHKEIASTLGISESTSKTQLMKARKLLKTQYEQKYSFNLHEYERV